MSIKIDASPDELDSPHFKENQRLSEIWKQFSSDNDGDIKGVINAWSYHFRIKISRDHNWVIDVKKATYTSGNLMLSSKYQNLLESVEIKSDFKLECDSFRVRKSKRLDIFTGRRAPLAGANNYNFIGSKKSNELVSTLMEHLKKGFKFNIIQEISFKDRALTIRYINQNNELWFIEDVLKIDSLLLKK